VELCVQLTVAWLFVTNIEICSPKVNQIIDGKLAKGEEPNFGYGKLMERLLFFKKNGVGFYQKLIPIAEKRLAQYNIPLEPPVRYLIPHTLVNGECEARQER
jgi:hypothetical protein